MIEKKQRVWELDALRGFCILAMVLIHLFFDLSRFGHMTFNLPGWFVFLRTYGHVLFVLISGICATFSSNTFRRGVMVFGAGLLVSYVTMFMDYILDITNMRIWFGILHMLGLCMILYPLFRKLPWWVQGLFGVAFVVLGFWMQTVTVKVPFLFPLGLTNPAVYPGSDFFPIFPGLGWFLIGSALGKTVYKKRQSLLPKVNSELGILRFFRFCGRHSLELYLLHQPVLVIAVSLIFG